MSLLGRLLRLTPHEALVRTRQALVVRRDRTLGSARTRTASAEALLRHAVDWGVMPGAERSMAGWLAHFRARPVATFAGLDDPRRTAESVRQAYPEDFGHALEEATQIAQGNAVLFGSPYELGTPPDWHVEPRTGKRYPDVHWSRLAYLNPESGGEYKLPWELARHQYLLAPARAWLYTGEERYAQLVVAHIRDWISHNPPGRGIHWASALEVAYRALSWIWILHLLKDSAALDDEAFAEIVCSLHVHGLHVEANLSTYYSPNTHLTGEALALLTMGLVFPELRRAARWTRQGHTLLSSQVPVHLQSDGVYFEQSTQYHRYAVDIFLQFLLLCRKHDLPVPRTLESRLELALDHLMNLTQPDGRSPLLGDDDGGRLLPLDNRLPDDFRSSLAVGALVFERGDFAWVAGPDAGPEAYWLLGPERARALASLATHPPTSCSQGFAEGGFFVMRDGWGPRADVLVVDCGPHGTRNCGHAHADLLSFTITARGVPMVSDPGTYTYSSRPDLRHWFRSAEAHNVVTVSGVAPSEPAGPFSWRRVGHGRLQSWRRGPRADWFEGVPAIPLPNGAIHRRAILFLKGVGWIVRDRVEGPADGGGTEQVVSRLHAPPGARVAEHGSGLRIESQGEVLVVHWLADEVETRVARAPFSPGYGRLLEGDVVEAEASGVLPLELWTVLIPSGEAVECLRSRTGEISIQGLPGGDALRLLHGEALSEGAELVVFHSGGGADGPTHLYRVGGQGLSHLEYTLVPAPGIGTPFYGSVDVR